MIARVVFAATFLIAGALGTAGHLGWALALIGAWVLLWGMRARP